MVKLGLHLWQKAILSEDLLQYGGLCPNSKHLYIVIRWHVSLYDLYKGPKCIFLVEDFSQPKDQEVEALNVSDCRVPPYVSTKDSLNGCLNLWRIVRLLRKGSWDISCNLLKHRVRVLLDHVVLQC